MRGLRRPDQPHGKAGRRVANRLRFHRDNHSYCDWFGHWSQLRCCVSPIAPGYDQSMFRLLGTLLDNLKTVASGNERTANMTNKQDNDFFALMTGIAGVVQRFTDCIVMRHDYQVQDDCRFVFADRELVEIPLLSLSGTDDVVA